MGKCVLACCLEAVSPTSGGITLHRIHTTQDFAKLVNPNCRQMQQNLPASDAQHEDYKEDLHSSRQPSIQDKCLVVQLPSGAKIHSARSMSLVDFSSKQCRPFGAKPLWVRNINQAKPGIGMCWPNFLRSSASHLHFHPGPVTYTYTVTAFGLSNNINEHFSRMRETRMFTLRAGSLITTLSSKL